MGRLAAWTVVAGLLVEMVIIVAAVARGTISHFNVSSPGAGALWALMGVSIAVVWVVNLGIAALLWRSADADSAIRLAIRVGLVLGLAGWPSPS